jgi:hypothetical protein
MFEALLVGMLLRCCIHIVDVCVYTMGILRTEGNLSFLSSPNGRTDVSIHVVPGSDE